MANKFKVINNTVNDKLVGLQFATDGGTPLFTVGNFQIETTFSEKQNKDYSIGEASDYLTLNDIGVTTPEDNILRKNKTKLILNPDYTQPKTYSYFGSLKEYFRVNIEEIIVNWPASIYVDNVINTFTGNTIQNYGYNPVTNKSTFNVNNSFFVNYFDIKYVSQYNSNESLDNTLRNLNVEYGKYTIFYNNIEYPINSYTGSSQPYNDNVYFEVIGNPFPLTTGGTLSTKYHIKPNSVEVEKFFSSLSDLSNQLLDRYVVPTYSSKFSYFKSSEQGPYDIYVNQLFTWPVLDGYNLDIVSTGYTTYLSDLYQFCDYFDENDTNIMNRRLVAEAINRLNTIRRGDGSEDENEAERVSKLINIFAREFDEVKKYIDGLSYIRTLTYDKNANTPDSLVKNLSNTLGWSLLTPMSDVDLISSFIPTQSVYSGYTINYSKYDAEIEFWRRLIVNTAHIWRSKGSRKAIEFIFEFIGTPEQLVSFNEHIYMAKKPINVDIFKIILKELTGFDDITPFNVDENGFPKTLPETPYNYYQSDGLWYRETAGSGTNLNVFEGNNPHIGPYDGGKNYINQFKCLIDTFSATSISIFNEYIIFTNLFKNYSNGLFDDYSGNVYLNSYNLDGKPNICFSVTGAVTTDPSPEYVLGLCGCPVSVSDYALIVNIKKNNLNSPCGTKDSGGKQCDYVTQGTVDYPPVVIFSGLNSENIYEVSLECCKSNTLIPDATWAETTNGVGYCYTRNDCNELKIIGSSNGNLIFYNPKTGLTGLTAIELGIQINSSPKQDAFSVASPLAECCKLFGGVIIDGGYCNIQKIKTQDVTPKTEAVAIKGDRFRATTTFGDVNDLGSIVSRDAATVAVYGAAASTSSSESPSTPKCQLVPIKDINGDIVLNSNGTISFTYPEKPYVIPPTAECCSAYSTTNLPLTFCGGNCYWVNPNDNCNNVDDLKISLGVDGNDGVYILTGSSDTCYFQVEFDMLVNFDCTEFSTCIGQDDILPILSAFTINATIESDSGSTSNTLQTFPAFKFNINNKPTGIYFSGQESVCKSINNQILLELGNNCDIVTEDTFDSKWVNIKFNISNQAIGKKIKLGFQFNNVPCNFNFLLDNIKIERLCVVTNEDILNITNCVGFDLERIIDNKKSWEYTESPIVRSVNYLDYRDTYYIENDSRLLINTKEVDLTLDAAKAIDNDVFCYAVKNDCFFSATTSTLDPYISQYKDEIDSIDNVEKFRNFVLTRLIDPKSRQVIRDYPLLRYVYNKYLNLCGNNVCDNLGNQYNYDSLQSFIELIGDYWIELVEQLVPSTSLWKGATRFYRNTIFDQPKYKYKNYSLLTCNPECTTIINTGSTDCVSTFTPILLEGLVKISSRLSDPRLYESQIARCWESKYGAGFIKERTIPEDILKCLGSSGKTLDLATLSVSGEIDGVTIFDEVIVTGETINDITGVTYVSLLEYINTGFTNNGYSITYSGENFYVTSPTINDCGKTIDINFCLDLDLSCVSGGTATYPNILTSTIYTPTRSMSISSSNKMYVCDSNIISVIDCTTNSVINTIPLVSYPAAISYSSTQNYMFVLGTNGYMYTIDCSTDTIINNILICTYVNAYGTYITYNSNNDTMYVTNAADNNIYVIDCALNTLIETIVSPLIISPKQMSYNSVDNLIYCNLSTTQKIVVLDCNIIGNTTISTFINGVGNLKDMVWDSNNYSIFLVSDQPSLSGYYLHKIDCNVNIITSTIPIFYGASLIEYCPIYDVIYIVAQSGGRLDIFDGINLTQIMTLNLGLYSSASEILYNTTENLIYVSDLKSGIYVLDTQTSSEVVSANCKTCYTILKNVFETTYNSVDIELFDCEKCVGLKDDGVEVIIESIEIPYGTGSTEVSCVDNTNKTICSKIFIKTINDDVTFSGRIIPYRR